MKSRETLVRLKRFQVDEKRRRVTQIELMIGEFERMSADLDREITMEEQRAGISDMEHFAYPTYARAAKARRENMVRSIAELAEQMEEAKLELAEAFEELKKVELLESRERGAQKLADNARDQAAMDRIGLQQQRLTF